YREARKSQAGAAHCLIEAGQRLVEMKASLLHGEWLPWLACNAESLGFGELTAQRLLQLGVKKNVVNDGFTDEEAIEICRAIWGNDDEPRQAPHPACEIDEWRRGVFAASPGRRLSKQPQARVVPAFQRSARKPLDYLRASLLLRHRPVFLDRFGASLRRLLQTPRDLAQPPADNRRSTGRENQVRRRRARELAPHGLEYPRRVDRPVHIIAIGQHEREIDPQSLQRSNARRRPGWVGGIGSHVLISFLSRARVCARCGVTPGQLRTP